MSDVFLILSGSLSLLILVLIGLIVWKGKSSSSSKDESDEEEVESEEGPHHRSRSFRPPPVEKEGPTRRLNKRATGSKAMKEEEKEEQLAAIEEELGVTLEGKIGAKKLRKLEMKAERRAARDRETEEREERKQRQEMLDKKRKEEDEKREKEEQEQKEKERQEREEQERKELEEYLRLKESFEIQEEGFDESEEQDSATNKLQQFIQFIQDQKVVLLEDLAAHFHMKTTDAISRLQDLLSDETVVGVIDDRGKFIHITRPEMESVARFIRQRGRISLTELAEASNSLINLTPAPS